MFQIKDFFVVFLLSLFIDLSFSRLNFTDVQRIVGGVEAVPLSWPWMAYLQITFRSPLGSSVTFRCGGSLINSQYIVTAGHCVQTQGYTFSYAKITLGEHDLTVTSGKELVVYSTQVKRHPSYTSSPTNDIALFKLNSTVNFAVYNYLSAIIPAINDASTTYNPNKCIATGWGTTSDGGTTSNKLQQVVLPILSNSYCTSSYGSAFKSATMLCAGYQTGGKDTCQGDSGGPLQCPTPSGWYVLVGITSFGAGCARPNRPGVYTRVSAFNTWIQSNAI